MLHHLARIALAGGLLAALAAYAATGSLLIAVPALWLGSTLSACLAVLAGVAWECWQDRRPSDEWAAPQVLHGRSTHRD